jgi:hypothetical protein
VCPALFQVTGTSCEQAAPILVGPTHRWKETDIAKQGDRHDPWGQQYRVRVSGRARLVLEWVLLLDT